MAYKFLLLTVFFVALFVKFIMIIKKKPKPEEILVIVKPEAIGMEIINIMAVPLIVICYLWIFFMRLNRAIPVLFPKYLDKWYQIFDYKLLENIKESLLEKEMLSDFITVARFADSGLFYLIFSLIWIMIVCINIFYYFEKKGICDRGIYLGKASMYKWDDISSYEWKDGCSKKDREYKKLAVFVKNSKIIRWLIKKETTSVDIMVDMEDYEKAEQILRDKLVKKEGEK